uniref:Dolichol-phosphate mannosyltransferase subunit 3 n=1 Tax=Hucho hucho TaxID=62062 RepID=A0A4W5MWK6_9TELE
MILCGYNYIVLVKHQFTLGIRALKFPIILIDMTKLLEWVFGISVIGAALALVTFDLLDMRLPEACREVARPMPVYLLLVFGCYSLTLVAYGVATFNDCEEESKELQAQIKEAKEDMGKNVLKK